MSNAQPPSLRAYYQNMLRQQALSGEPPITTLVFPQITPPAVIILQGRLLAYSNEYIDNNFGSTRIDDGEAIQDPESHVEPLFQTLLSRQVAERGLNGRGVDDRVSFGAMDLQQFKAWFLVVAWNEIFKHMPIDTVFGERITQ